MRCCDVLLSWVLQSSCIHVLFCHIWQVQKPTESNGWTFHCNVLSMRSLFERTDSDKDGFISQSEAFQLAQRSGEPFLAASGCARQRNLNVQNCIIVWLLYDILRWVMTNIYENAVVASTRGKIQGFQPSFWVPSYEYPMSMMALCNFPCFHTCHSKTPSILIYIISGFFKTNP